MEAIPLWMHLSMISYAHLEKEKSSHVHLESVGVEGIGRESEVVEVLPLRDRYNYA